MLSRGRYLRSEVLKGGIAAKVSSQRRYLKDFLQMKYLWSTFDRSYAKKLFLESTSRPVVGLKIGDQYSYVVTDRPEIIKILRQQFQFVSKAFWFSRARAQSRNSKFHYVPPTNFISEKGRFMAGLTDEIADRLELMNIEVVRDDRRVIYHEKLEHKIVESEILGEGVSLYDYQVDVANMALEEKRGIIKCATGGGKTMIFTAILKAFSQKYPAMMLCRSKSVIDQTKSVFEKHGLENVGIVYMNNVKPDLITCATAQSIRKLEPLLSKIRILLVDEVHEWASKECERTLKLFDNCVYKLGFSATPFNEDQIHNYKLIGLLGPQLCDVSIGYLKEKNILSSCHAHFYRIEVPSIADSGSAEETYLQSDNNGIVENMNLHRKVVEIVQNIPKGRILILVRRLSHGDRLKELLPEAYWVRGEDNYKTREYVLSQLRHSTSEKVVAIMSAIGFYGLNVLCHHLVNTCGGKDANLLIQKVGRGLRRGIDKTHLEYHDFMFHGDKFLNRHSKIRMQVLKSEGHDVTIDDALRTDK